MPPLLPALKVIRFDLRMTKGADSQVRDRFFMQYSGAGPTAADLTTLLNTLDTAWGTNIQPLQDAATTLTSVTATDLTSSTNPQVVKQEARTGTRVGSGLPAAVSPVLRFKINRRYRGSHPRLYLPAGVGTDTSTAQQWTTAFTAAVVAGWNAFIAAIQTTPPTNIGTLSQVTLSYFQGFTNKTFPSGRSRPVPTPRPAGPVIDTVVSVTMNPNFGSQRRRNLQSP